eukprot:TRINITY_DN11734_c0_g1_i2.p1 TRINITY_DN11734_c0_g1~~TRINITY_DN11734_c0_g1_i2.p1  ORF type:complete len:375 (-),score=46.75 TRINITY_DN11734_c0_g1_i2:394-1416(-)
MCIRDRYMGREKRKYTHTQLFTTLNARRCQNVLLQRNLLWIHSARFKGLVQQPSERRRTKSSSYRPESVADVELFHRRIHPASRRQEQTPIHKNRPLLLLHHRHLPLEVRCLGKTASYIQENRKLDLSTQPTESVPCMKDVFMDYLQDMNNLVHEDEHLRKFLQITASISMDTVFLSLFIYWVLRGNSSRMFFAVASFYAVRLLVQQVVMMGFPQGYLWESPGFPSLVVPYGRTSDFYFSGHCGFLMICACEWWELGHKFVACIVHVVNLYMAYVMVVFQIHYTIDIFTGVIVGHYIFIYISKIAPYIDALLKKMYMCFTSAKTEPVKFANNAGLQNRIM